MVSSERPFLLIIIAGLPLVVAGLLLAAIPWLLSETSQEPFNSTDFFLAALLVLAFQAAAVLAIATSIGLWRRRSWAYWFAAHVTVLIGIGGGCGMLLEEPWVGLCILAASGLTLAVMERLRPIFPSGENDTTATAPGAAPDVVTLRQLGLHLAGVWLVSAFFLGIAAFLGLWGGSSLVHAALNRVPSGGPFYGDRTLMACAGTGLFIGAAVTGAAGVALWRLRPWAWMLAVGLLFSGLPVAMLCFAFHYTAAGVIVSVSGLTSGVFLFRPVSQNLFQMQHDLAGIPGVPIPWLDRFAWLIHLLR